MKILIFLSFILGQAWADSIYLQHTADLEQRKIKFSFLPNITKEVMIKECNLVRKKSVIHKFELNLKLLPQKEIRTFEHEFNFPPVLLARPDSFDDLKVVCDSRVKATGWAFTSVATSRVVPKGWEITSSKLKIKKGEYQIASNLSLNSPQIEIEAGSTITLNPGVILELEGDFAPLRGIQFRGENRGAVILKSKKDLLLEKLSLEGGKDKIFQGNLYDCSLCIWAPKIVMNEIDLKGQENQYGLKLFASKVELKDVSVSSINTGAYIHASESQLGHVHIRNTKANSLLLLGGKAQILNSDFIKSENNLVKCTNNCKLDIQKSLFKEAEYGIWADNSSSVNSSHNDFQLLSVALGSYRTKDWWTGSLIKEEASKYSEVKLQKDADDFSKVER